MWELCLFLYEVLGKNVGGDWEGILNVRDWTIYCRVKEDVYRIVGRPCSRSSQAPPAKLLYI